MRGVHAWGVAGVASKAYTAKADEPIACAWGGGHALLARLQLHEAGLN